MVAMISANAEYLIGTFLLLAALASPIVFCAGAWFGQRLPNARPPRDWYRVALYWAGALGVTADVYCIFLAATFDPKDHFLMGKLDRINSSFLTGVPVIFLIAIGIYTVALCLALTPYLINPMAMRIANVLRNKLQNGRRCPLSYRTTRAGHFERRTAARRTVGH